MRLDALFLLHALAFGIRGTVGLSSTPRALIDTRQYAVCKLIGANSTSGIVEGGFGTLKKPERKTEKNITWECVGVGITNDSGKDQTFDNFDCTVILSEGVQINTQKTTASLSKDGKELLQCTYDIESQTSSSVTAQAPVPGQVSQVVQAPEVGQVVQQSPSGTAVEGQVVSQPGAG